MQNSKQYFEKWIIESIYDLFWNVVYYSPKRNLKTQEKFYKDEFEHVGVFSF